MRSPTPLTFARKLQLYIGAVAGAVLAITVWSNYSASRQALEEQTNQEALKQIRAGAESLDDFVARIGMLPRTIAARQRAIGARPDPDVVAYLAQLLGDMSSNEVYGVYLAFDRLDWHEPMAMPWIDRKTFPGARRVEYDYHDPKWEWYNAPKNTRRFNVTEPYYDDGGSNITMVSLNAPIVGEDGRYIGTAGADLHLDRLLAIVNEIRLRKTALDHAKGSSEFSYIVSRSGRIIAHPDARLMLSSSSPGADVRTLPEGPQVAAHASGSARLRIDGRSRRVFWFQAPLTGWKVALNIPESDVLDPVNALTVRSSLIAVAGLSVMLALIALVARRMTEPVSHLTAAAEAIERGRFVPEALDPVAARRDEMAGLAHAFQTMGQEIRLREQRLADWNRSLEQTVADRTAELARAATDAEAARQEAESANRTKSAFLANMSHELRTPMNAILGYSEMLIEEAEELTPDSLIADLQKINAAGKHLLGLINDVLDLSKIEAGKMTIFVEPFDVPSMVSDVATTIAPLVSKNGNALDVRCPPDLGTMRADLTKVRQTLFNLLSNAAKFTDHGTIVLEAGRRSTMREEIVFRVADSGIGMTADRLGRLFEAFAQAESSTTRKYGGTGLGLAISRNFCRAMGGDITVASEAGKGTTFTVVLPRVVPAPRSTSAGTMPASASEPPRVPRGPTVLVIDDDESVRELLERDLTKDGYEVLLAPDGKTGVAMARRQRPDAIVLDLIMPEMDGWAVLAEIQNDPVLQPVPVIMASMLDGRDMGLALGAEEYLTKPLDRARLRTALERLTGAPESRTVLIVDDDPDAREAARRLLVADGWRVVAVEHGRAALEAIARERPALVLLDLLMPEMDGFEFLQELRAHHEWRDLPVVVLTAKDLTPADHDRLRATAQRVLQKGALGRDDLLAEIRTSIRQQTRPTRR